MCFALLNRIQCDVSVNSKWKVSAIDQIWASHRWILFNVFCVLIFLSRKWNFLFLICHWMLLANFLTNFFETICGLIGLVLFVSVEIFLKFARNIPKLHRASCLVYLLQFGQRIAMTRFKWNMIKCCTVYTNFVKT